MCICTTSWLNGPMAASIKVSSCCVSISVSPSCSFLGELCLLAPSEHSFGDLLVAPSDFKSESWPSHSKTKCSFPLWRDFFVTSSHVSVPSIGGGGQCDQLLCSGSSHSSESECDFHLSESVSSPPVSHRLVWGTGFSGVQDWGGGMGICCSSHLQS